MPPAGRSIRLVPIGGVDPGVLSDLRPEIRRRFAAEVSTGEPVPVRSEWRDAARKQVRADAVLDALVEARPAGGTWVLGIVEADLFVPGFNFVFGQATVEGCCAVIGLARLRPEFHHMPADPPRFAHRVLTEAVHELGHIAGLSHCPDPICVMHYSRDIVDTDRKGPRFCRNCRARRP